MSELGRAAMSAAVIEAEGISGPRGDAPWSIRFLKSPAFRCLTKTAHMMLGRISVEWSNGRDAVTHAQFIAYGVPRDGISHGTAELEGLGILTVARRTAHANSFTFSQRWRLIGSLSEARAARDKARRFGLQRRRRVERETARMLRAQRLAQIKTMIGAPTHVDELDDATLSILSVIVDAIGHSRGVAGAAVSYDQLSDASGVHRNTVAASLRTLRELGLIEVTRGKRGRNIFRLSASSARCGTDRMLRSSQQETTR